MKKFTSYMAICLMVMTTSSAFSQDAGVIDLPDFDPVTPTTVYPNVPSLIRYERKNFGSSAITSSTVDSLTMEQWVDQVKRLTFYRDMSSPFAAGTTEVRNGGTAMDWSSLGLTAGNNSLCVKTVLWKGGVDIDVDNSNDEWCLVVNYTGDNNPLQWDLAVQNINVEDGSGAIINDGGLVTDDGGVAFVRFDVYNNGITDLPSGVIIQFELSFNGTPEATIFNITLNQPLGAGGTLPQLGMDLDKAGIFLPASGGKDLKICVKMVNNPDDTDNSNDEGCSTFNSTLSVEDIAIEDNIKIKYYNRNLNIVMTENITGVMSLDIISVSGQLVQNLSLNANLNTEHNVSLDNLNSGVYIVNVRTEDNQVKSQRIILE